MKHILRQFTQREAHPLIQFMKYGIAGVMATGVDLCVTFVLAWKVFPAFTEDDQLIQLIRVFWPIELVHVSEQVRTLNFVIDRTISFLISNGVCYVINFMWVFESGRHSRKKEITLFYVVSIVSFLIGTGLAAGMISFTGCTTTVALVANIFASVMINYVCRKYIVFKG